MGRNTEVISVGETGEPVARRHLQSNRLFKFNVALRPQRS